MTRPKRLPLYVVGGAGLSALALSFGLTLSHNGPTASAVSTTPPSTVIATRSTNLGQILVDVQGRSLYLFAKDNGPASTCIGSCAAAWPPVPVQGAPHVGGGAAATSVGVIKRSDGSQQLSYDGHPLYYFAGDSKVGQTRGQGVTEFGGKWWVLNSAGTAIRSAPASSGQGGKGGGYGY